MNIEKQTGTLPTETKTTPEKKKLPPIDFVETAQGSIYKYLPDGRTQRFKKAENRICEPQNALVFVPDFAWVRKNAPKEVLKFLGENEVQYEQELLEYVQRSGKKNYIVDQTGKKLETNEAIINTDGPVYLTFGDNSGKVDFLIPVTVEPRMGYYTFDTRKYQDGDQLKRETHFGNKVVKIVEKPCEK